MNAQHSFLVPGCLSYALSSSDASTIRSLGEKCVFESSDPEVGPSGVPSLHLSRFTNLTSETLP